MLYTITRRHYKRDENEPALISYRFLCPLCVTTHARNTYLEDGDQYDTEIDIIVISKVHLAKDHNAAVGKLKHEFQDVDVL